MPQLPANIVVADAWIQTLLYLLSLIRFFILKYKIWAQIFQGHYIITILYMSKYLNSKHKRTLGLQVFFNDISLKCFKFKDRYQFQDTGIRRTIFAGNFSYILETQQSKHPQSLGLY